MKSKRKRKTTVSKRTQQQRLSRSKKVSRVSIGAAKKKNITSKKHVNARGSRKKKPITKAARAKREKKINKSLFPTPVRKVAPAVAAAMAENDTSLFQAESFFKAKIKVIGIGGGGGSIVSEIGRSLHKATFLIADTDVRSFKKKAGVKHFLFGQKLTHGMGTGANPDIARSASLEVKEKIAKLFEDQDIVVLVASLGGGVGSGATQVFAEALKNFGGISLGIFTLPFLFEGQNKRKIAAKSLKELRGMLNVSITIPNEKIFKVIKEDTPITQAFSMVNKNLIESLESLIDLIYVPGIINIDFADVRAILKGKGNLAFLNTVEAQGKDKAEKTIKRIFNNPLYQYRNFKADKILFNISGGNNLSMVEVQKISNHVRDLNPKAKIIFGISKNPKFNNKIKTTILATGPQATPDISLKKRKAKTKKKKVFQKGKKGGVFRGASSRRQKGIPFERVLSPVFRNVPLEVSGVAKTVVGESSNRMKKAVRRNALEIREDELLQEGKKTEQEKEWDIPAFLRFKK